MKSVNVSQLRQKLPEYLAEVQRGEHLQVTSRGKVVAEIAPPRVSRDAAAAARARLRGSVRRYDYPLEPVMAPEDWNMNR